MTGLGLKLPHGPHRRPMGGFAAFPSPETSSEARATMARCPRRVQRDSLGAAHRRSLARSARPLSALSNLPSPPSLPNWFRVKERLQNRPLGVGEVHVAIKTQA